MILYLDTSAFLKLYVVEPESQLVRESVCRARIITTHVLAYAEMRAGFAKALRLNRILAEELPHQVKLLDSDWERMRIVSATEELVRRAGSLSERYGLRGYDSIHLAAVESVHGFFRGSVDFLFAVFDGDLRKAAVAHGIPVIAKLSEIDTGDK